jgi:IS5 family transposase
VQGAPDRQRDLWDAESVVGHLLPAGGVFAFLAEQRMALFPASMFEDLFPSGLGRPSLPPDVVAAVMVLQALHGTSDRETAEAVRFDLRWKVACGLPVTAAGFHSTALTYWRRRLAKSDRPDRIFEVVRQVVAATGVLRGKTRRALDSTVLDDAVARQDTVTQLIAAVRRVGRDVPGAAALIPAVCTGYDYTRTGKPDIAWDDPGARDELVSALVNDALALLARLQGRLGQVDANEWPVRVCDGAEQAVALLALVAGQDVEPAEGSEGTDGRWRIARKVAPDRVISTVDPDARHAHKTQHRRQDGFKAHVVVEPDTGLITETELTKAAGPDTSDGAVGVRLLEQDTSIPRLQNQADEQTDEDSVQGGVQVLGDSAYGSGEVLADLQTKGHEPIIKPWPVRPAVSGGFTTADFTVDEAARTVTCPHDVTRPMDKNRVARFGTACAGCPLRARCTTSKTGRDIKVHSHDALHRAHRARAADPDFQATYRRHRPMVERSLAWLTRGNRRVPYRGVAKNNAWLRRRVAALNLRRLLVLGLDRRDDHWVLARA